MNKNYYSNVFFLVIFSIVGIKRFYLLLVRIVMFWYILKLERKIEMFINFFFFVNIMIIGFFDVY